MARRGGPNIERDKEIRRRYRAGEPQYLLAVEFGVCRQRIEQIIHYTRDAARKAIHDRVKRGEILPHSSCQACGATGARIQAHHEDYSRPLDVVWLCYDCHTKADAARLLRESGFALLTADEAAQRAGVTRATIFNWVRRGRLKVSKKAGRGHKYYFTPKSVDEAAAKPREGPTHCPRGHEYTPENTGLNPGDYIRCNACNSIKVGGRAQTRDSIYLLRTALRKCGIVIEDTRANHVRLKNGMTISAGQRSPWIVRDGDVRLFESRRALDVVSAVRRLSGERLAAAA